MLLIVCRLIVCTNSRLVRVPGYEEQLQKRLRALGERLRRERHSAGFSQEGLAEAAGLHRTYVGSVERGERNITVGSLYALADVLGIDASELLSR
jgi:ribosome-binding protein aMBF1 (putative translation factor)